jgi:hypothetical protein
VRGTSAAEAAYKAAVLDEFDRAVRACHFTHDWQCSQGGDLVLTRRFGRADDLNQFLSRNACFREKRSDFQ